VMGECENWQNKFYIAQTNCKHYEGGYVRLPLSNVYTCHGFLPIMASLKKINSKTFLYKPIKGFVD
jgi:hypothetical protein